MFKIRPGMPKPPPGFQVIEAKLVEFDAAMRLAVQDESKGVMGQTTRTHTRSHDAHNRPAKTTRDGDDEALTHKRARSGGAPIRTHSESEADEAEHNTHRSDTEHTSLSDHTHEEGEEEEKADSSSSSNSNLTSTTTTTTTSAAIPPLWRVAQINHDRTRYVYDAYHRTHSISKAVFDYCCSMSFIDAGLARRWRLPGYEQLCCTACGVPGEASLAATRNAKYALRDQRAPKDRKSAIGGATSLEAQRMTCICRVPAAQRKSRTFLACAVCGCRGCCSADVSASVKTSKGKDASEDEH